MEKQKVKLEEIKSMNMNYNRDKNGWVMFKAKNRKKVKLRVHVSTLAKALSEANDELYAANRDELIKAYEFGGLDMLAKHYQETMIAIYNKELETLKKQKDEIEVKTTD